MNISLIIPVYNDTENLIRLLDQAANLGCFTQVIVIDDCSDPPLRRAIIAPPDTPENWLSLKQNPKRLGPGPSRNWAIDLVKTSHLLYLDSDDLLTNELLGLLADLKGRDFDFCLFKHHDSRMKSGQTPHDEAFWQAAKLGTQTLSKPDNAAIAQLAQTANYPWNKIYRSDFLRQSNARCSNILLHEDVALHWQSFLHAKSILSSPRSCVQHFVEDSANRLTNLQGGQRLAFFEVLPGLYDQIKNNAPPALTLAFLHFVTGLLYWIEYNTSYNLRRRVRRLTGGFIKQILQDLPLQDIKVKDPALFRCLINQQRRGRFIRLPKLRRNKRDLK